eukprot:m.25510 g.25510  ORF g.25510 m.25510 type:complete len:92 (-) comp7710_c0_seq1:875-1150(-)
MAAQQPSDALWVSSWTPSNGEETIRKKSMTDESDAVSKNNNNNYQTTCRNLMYHMIRYIRNCLNCALITNDECRVVFFTVAGSVHTHNVLG